ncbi:MAG: SMP-30/gluconolactonase/LRE family protein [Dehalococcoidia bacterium]
MGWEWELVAGPFSRLTEGPAWDGKTLLFTYIPASRIMSYDPQSGECTVYRENTNHTNGLAFDADGNLYGCCSGGRSIVRFEPDGSTTTIVDSLDRQRLNTPNDLAIDRQGRIWFSNPWNAGNIDPSEQQEMVNKDILRADPQPDGSWTCQRMTFDTTGTNGLLISPDQRSLYIIQTDNEPGGIREFRSYPILDDGSLGQYVVLHQFGGDHRGPQRGIDGMCLDSEGNIVGAAGSRANGPGPMLYVWTPTGRVLETLPMPVGVDGPTNCCFGDPDQRTLYVTTGGGHLLRARDTGRRGWILWPPVR